ncbi:glycoside hydrolase family 24 protein [Serratia marcescens]|uniref:glycoside hydrolase family 24 protein n=1 Tax=Serratia marcescens TaxID=615 RepID=UPI00148E3AB7|nr:glycoside hydrolase family 104 protein [Serratia marcescens]QJU39667.1 glycoside hydrolase family 104 protein [Serratia marcescens]
MAEVIDSLLVSLGLETDKKSFDKANAAINSVRSGFLQLAAAAGVGFGFKALTSDIAKSTMEMDRLSRTTGFAVKQIGGLRFALKALGQDPDAANSIIQKIPSLQQMAKQGELGSKAYWSGTFNPTEFANKSGMDAFKYLVESYGRMDHEQQRNLRSGIGAGDNDPLTRIMELGSKGLDDVLKAYEPLYQALDPKLIESSIKFNMEMAKLSTNFENLAMSISGPLMRTVNELIQKGNQVLGNNQNELERTFNTILDGTWYTDFMNHADKKGKQLRNLARDSYVVKNDAFLQWMFGEKEVVPDGDLPIERLVNQAAIRVVNHIAENDHLLGKVIPVQKELPFFLPNSQQASNQLSNENLQKYLNVIALSEGTAGYMNNGYNTMFGGDQFSDMSDHPRILKEFTDKNGKRNKTSAAGRYQFTQASWDEAKSALNLPDFSPRSQDMAALYLIQRAGQLDNVKNGNFAEATAGLGGVWASLPSSTYAQPKHSYEAMENFYAMNNTPPSFGGAAGGSRTVTVNNQFSINASGANADEVADIVFGRATDSVNQAVGQLPGDKF